MKNKFLTALFAIFAITVNAFSQSFNKAELDKFFDVLAGKNQAMGSLAIAKEGEIIYSRAIGYSRIEGADKIPAFTQTKYRIGSISKTFTAALIFQLVESGKLNLTDKLSKFFPQVPNAEKITVSNLLNHRSGIHNFTSDKEYLTYYTKPKTQSEMLEIISKTKPDFEPNAKADYSNSNYVLLGFIIEKITGKLYKTVLKEKITSKIGLKDTYVGSKTDVKSNESFSYSFAGSWKVAPETDMSVPSGAGAIVSTPSDLVKFIDALFAGKIVSENSLNQMKTLTEGVGMGLFRYPLFDSFGYGHTGGIDGFNSMIVYVPEKKLAVAYISNGTVFSINDIMLAAFSAAYDQPIKIPNFDSLALKSEDLDKYLGVYSSKDIPLKITIIKESTTLFAQATGQGKLPLTAFEKDKFKFEEAGIVMEFAPANNQFTLLQGGKKYYFVKD